MSVLSYLDKLQESSLLPLFESFPSCELTLSEQRTASFSHGEVGKYILCLLQMPYHTLTSLLRSCSTTVSHLQSVLAGRERGKLNRIIEGRIDQ